MRADNDGEGGILALCAGARAPARAAGAGASARSPRVVLFGAALLYGDGIITPAISVLSAVEGLEVAAPELHHYVVPITCAVLLGALRHPAPRHRRHRPQSSARSCSSGSSPSPLLGVRFIALAPRRPARAVADVRGRASSRATAATTFVVLGAVVLAITGGEALYADMGHFGAQPIRLAWFALVMPALVLNYFGQGALLLHDPSARGNPFFAMVPRGRAHLRARRRCRRRRR